MRLPVNFIYLSLRAARPGVRLILFFGGLLGVASAGYYFQLGFGQVAFKHFLLGLGSFCGIPAYEAMLMLLDTEERD
ncbi:MAG: hypothetical protein WBK91_02820 [Alphaproteobacteria bacterium]